MSARPAWLALLGLSTAACGNTSEPVIEPIASRAPPEFTHRVDVLLVSAASGCAMGNACFEADPERCFYVSSKSGVSYFEPEGFEFTQPDDPRLPTAPQSACFQLELDAAGRERAKQAFHDLRSAVFQLSQGNVDLDVRLHEVDPDWVELKSWGAGGVFLQPSSLASVGVPLMNRDTDFTFAVTGESSSSGELPKLDPCGGTNWEMRGGLAGAAYTWLSTSCLSTATVRWHLLYQAVFAVRDVLGLVTPEADEYPACGGSGDPQEWFPRPSDCSLDPDAVSCGDPRCDDEPFAAHVFAAHWPAAGLIGNHCRNGRQDYDETAPDAGGVCDALGR